MRLICSQHLTYRLDENSVIGWNAKTYKKNTTNNSKNDFYERGFVLYFTVESRIVVISMDYKKLQKTLYICNCIIPQKQLVDNSIKH